MSPCIIHKNGHFKSFLSRGEEGDFAVFLFLVRVVIMFGIKGKTKEEIYADYAAATPLGTAARKVLLRYAKEGEKRFFANPSSTHTGGIEARDALLSLRKDMAKALSIHPDELYFTSGGTEGNNLALLGVVTKAQETKKRVHVVTSLIEHSSILSVCKALLKKGVEVTFLSPNEKGFITQSMVEKALTEDTVLVTLSLVNGELGSITPLRDVSRTLKEYKKKQGRSTEAYPYLHTDASQAMALLPLSPHNLGVDLLTFDAGKGYGPKGIGGLIALRGRALAPILFGGSQERGLRPGTENLMLIEALSAAYFECVAEMEKEWKRLLLLEEYFLKEMALSVGGITRTVRKEKEADILPGFVSLCIPGLSAEFAVVQLAEKGVAVSSASACVSLGGSGRSYVVEALPGGEKCAEHTLRITFGRFTKKSDVGRLVRILALVISRKK